MPWRTNNLRGYDEQSPIGRQMHKIQKTGTRVSKNFVFLAAACLAASGAVAQVTPPSDLPPSPLEAFAAKPTATVGVSKVIGRIFAPEAQATLTVMTVADPSTPEKTMRGIRIDLAHVGKDFNCDLPYTEWAIMCARPKAAVYIEEARLKQVHDWLMRGAADTGFYGYISANGNRSGMTGMTICGYYFPGHLTTELAALFSRAIAELQAVR